MLCTYHACMLYCCFDNYLAVVNIFIAGKLRILKYRLECLCKKDSIELVVSTYDKKNSPDLTSISQEFSSCVRQHQFLIWVVEEVESLYSFLNLVSVATYSLIICLAGYQLIMVSNLILLCKVVLNNV